MRKLLLILPFLMPLAAHPQGLNYVPPARAAYVNAGSGWVPNSAAADFGAIAFVPQAAAMYCQASEGALWTPCTGGGGGTPFDPASPGPIGGTTPSTGVFTTVTGTTAVIAGPGNNSNPGYRFTNDATTGFSSGIGAGNITMYNSGFKANNWSAVRYTISSGLTIQWASGADVTTNGADTGLSRLGAGSLACGNGTAADVSCLFSAGKYATGTNCSSAASPAVCGSASAGSFVIAAASTTAVVDTTAVTANSQILLTPDETLGTKLGVTCNTTAATALATIGVTARTAGTSFTVTTTGTVATNPACYSYHLVN